MEIFDVKETVGAVPDSIDDITAAMPAPTIMTSAIYLRRPETHNVFSHQPSVPVSPLNGPTTLEVIQPP